MLKKNELKSKFLILLKDTYNIDSVKHQDFLNYGYDSSSNKYILKGGWGGPRESGLLSKLIDYKIEDNELIALEKVGFEMMSEKGVLLTTDRSASADKVVKVITVDDNGEETVNHKEYFNDNLDKFNTYKHIFKKASDGKYYWYSSEIVNE